MVYQKLIFLWATKILAKFITGIFLFAAVSFANGLEGYLNTLKQVKQVKVCEVPSVRNDSIIYKMDIEFKTGPLNFWSYTDSIHHAHLIEIYGVSLEAPYIRLPDNSPFQSFRIKNYPTKMALSGLMSLIIISIDPEYSCDTDLTSEKIITLTLWKKMNALKGKIMRNSQKAKNKK